MITKLAFLTLLPVGVGFAAIEASFREVSISCQGVRWESRDSTPPPPFPDSFIDK